MSSGKTRTKIIATIGPASQAVPTLKRMIQAGMTAARLNFSHGTHASHRRLAAAVRRAAREVGKNVAIIADMQGPKIRVGALKQPIVCKHGDVISIPVALVGLGKHLKKGQRVLIDDGTYEAEFVSGIGRTITLRFSSPATIGAHVGLAFPGVAWKGVSSLTKKDREDAKVAMAMGADWIVLSFVSAPSDVRAMRRLIRDEAPPGRVPRVMLKIERAKAVERFDELLPLADAIMIGRGDLGLDVPPEDVPLIQKRITAACRLAGVPVVVATHMLESMITHPRPTRAEVSDVANAVMDHADAVMLSGETAKGRYPVEAVRMMAAVARETEASVYDDVVPKELCRRASRDEAMACTVAEMVAAGRVQALAVADHHADLLIHLLPFRPQVPVFYLGKNDTDLRQHLIAWGVEPLKISGRVSYDPERIAKYLQSLKRVSRSQTVTVLGRHGAEPVFTTVRV